MPYLRFGTLKGLREMQRAIKDAERKPTQPSDEKGMDHGLPKGEMKEPANDEGGKEPGNAIKQRKIAVDSQDKKGEGKIKEEIQHENRKLILAYLNHDNCLHISRTLDQFYYHSLSPEKLEYRNTHQVVFDRHRHKNVEGKTEVNNYQICMVDQLWLWVVDESTCAVLLLTLTPGG
jgi:hypothetical protein